MSAAEAASQFQTATSSQRTGAAAMAEIEPTDLLEMSKVLVSCCRGEVASPRAWRPRFWVLYRYRLQKGADE